MKEVQEKVCSNMKKKKKNKEDLISVCNPITAIEIEHSLSGLAGRDCHRQ